MNDLQSNTRAKLVAGPVAIGANGTITGRVIDRQGFGGVEFIASYGAVTTTGSTVTLVVKDGDASGALASVADAGLLGTEALASLPATTPRTSGVSQQVTKRVGYRGGKRYVTCDVVKGGTTSAGAVNVAALLHNPYNAPQANP